jgi:hypothetical protein
MVNYFTMSKSKYIIRFIIVLFSLFSLQAFSQQYNYRDSLAVYNSPKAISKPQLHYYLGSSFMFIPRVGSVAGVTISPVLSIPISKKVSVEGGIIAGRYSAFGSFNHESTIAREFTGLSVFGSASYHVNSQLTLYGAGIKQLTSSSPFLLPKSSFVIGSSYKFENFSIGVSVQTSKWNNNHGPLPYYPGVYSPFEQRQGTFMPFGR